MTKNRKKKANLSPAMFALLVLTALSLGTTGVLHTVMKNRQLQLVREIENVERRIKEHDRDITNLDIKVSTQENRFDLRKALWDSQTTFQRIPLSAVEDIHVHPPLPKLASND